MPIKIENSEKKRKAIEAYWKEQQTPSKEEEN